MAQLGDILAHPFTLTAMTLIVSGLLVTWLTNRWQNKRLEFEIRSTLINDITETSVILTSALSSGFYNKSNDEKVEEAVIKISKIGSILHNYFPQDMIQNEWETYKIVCISFWRNIVNSKSNSDYPLSQNSLKEIQMYIEKFSPQSKINWDAILNNKNDLEIQRVGGILMDRYKYFVMEIRKRNIKIT